MKFSWWAQLQCLKKPGTHDPIPYWEQFYIKTWQILSKKFYCNAAGDCLSLKFAAVYWVTCWTWTFEGFFIQTHFLMKIKKKSYILNLLCIKTACKILYYLGPTYLYQKFEGLESSWYFSLWPPNTMIYEISH